MCKITKYVTLWLVIIGALNWGLVGFFNFDLVAFLLGDMTIWTRSIYVLVALSAIIYGTMVYVCRDEAEAY